MIPQKNQILSETTEEIAGLRLRGAVVFVGFNVSQDGRFEVKVEVTIEVRPNELPGDKIPDTFIVPNPPKAMGEPLGKYWGDSFYRDAETPGYSTGRMISETCSNSTLGGAIGLALAKIHLTKTAFRCAAERRRALEESACADWPVPSPEPSPEPSPA